MPEDRPLLVDGERYTTRISPLLRGGGEKHHPQSLRQTRERLLPNAIALAEEANEIPQALRANRVVFLATLLPNYLANSYYPRQLMSLLGLVPLGSRADVGTLETRTRLEENVQTKSLIVAGAPESLAQLVALLDGLETETTPRQATDDLRRFQMLRLATEADIGYLGETDLYEAVLHPDPDESGLHRYPLSEANYRKWEAWVTENHGEVLTEFRRSVGGLTFVPVRLANGAFDQLARFNPLRGLRPLPEVRPIPDPFRGAGPEIAEPAGAPLSTRPVAIVDGGIDDTSPYFARYVTQYERTAQPAIARGQRHGTAVTSAFLYGHLAGGNVLPRPLAPVDHYRVWPPSDPGDPELYAVLDEIQNIVEDGNYEVLSLSLAPDEAVEDWAEPTRWTATLDQLAYEHGTLFVVAAGNNGERDAGAGLNRVQVPGDMVNGIAVGACNAPIPELPWERTSYSAVGPGRPGAVVRPTGVSFGGVEARRYETVSDDGARNGWTGTSFAAPSIARGIADLSRRIGPRSEINCLRALTTHFADGDGAPTPEFGYGRLRHDFTDVLDCAQNEVHLLVQGTARRDGVDRVVVPYPETVERDGNVTITWTVAYTSPTDPTEAVEYTQAALDVVFRPNRFIHTLNVPDEPSRPVDVRTQAAQIAEAYAIGGGLSDHPRTRAATGGSEAVRREDGKWETVRRSQVTMRASGVQGPTLDISYLAREDGQLVTNAPPLPYAVAITIRAASGTNLYDAVRAEFPALLPAGFARARLRATAP